MRRTTLTIAALMMAMLAGCSRTGATVGPLAAGGSTPAAATTDPAESRFRKGSHAIAVIGDRPNNPETTPVFIRLEFKDVEDTVFIANGTKVVIDGDDEPDEPTEEEQAGHCTRLVRVSVVEGEHVGVSGWMLRYTLRPVD